MTVAGKPAKILWVMSGQRQHVIALHGAYTEEEYVFHHDYDGVVATLPDEMAIDDETRLALRVHVQHFDLTEELY